jgi:regulator of extracellular matrix RemA (YlzA/DUF370 family)
MSIARFAWWAATGRHVQVRGIIVPEEKMEQQQEARGIHVSSIYGYNTRQPAVSLVVDGQEAQLSPVKAREVAQMLIVASEAAIQDAFLFEFATNIIGVNDEGAAQLVFQYREWRSMRKVDETDRA